MFKTIKGLRNLISKLFLELFEVSWGGKFIRIFFLRVQDQAMADVSKSAMGIFIIFYAYISQFIDQVYPD